MCQSSFNLSNSKTFIKGINSAFMSGQDGLLASLATTGITNSTYLEALVRCHIQCAEMGLYHSSFARPGIDVHREISGLITPSITSCPMGPRSS